MSLFTENATYKRAGKYGRISHKMMIELEKAPLQAVPDWNMRGWSMFHFAIPLGKNPLTVLDVRHHTFFLGFSTSKKKTFLSIPID